MSNDLISRQAAIDAVMITPQKWDGMYIQDLNCRLRDTLNALPSAQLERNNGKWIVDVLADNIYRCSECGVDAPVEPTGGTEYKSNYCPNCGAKMEGRAE